MLAQAQECSWQLAKLSMLNYAPWQFCLNSLRPIQEYSNCQDCFRSNNCPFSVNIIPLRANFADILVLSNCRRRHSEFNPLSCLRFSTRVSFRSPSECIPTIFQDWIAHMEAKARHFAAVSEYRESIVEYEARRSESKLLLLRNFLLTHMPDTELNSLVLPRR
jgi:hypothetical protein